MKRKKLVLLISLCVVLVFSIVGYILYDNYKFSTYVEKDGIQYKIENNSAILIDGTKANKKQYTLNKIKNKPITKIESNAFKGNQSIEQIVAFNLEEIGSNAFENTSLKGFDATTGNKEIILEIVSLAFVNCLDLQEVKLCKVNLYPEAFLNCGSFALTIAEDSTIENNQTLVTSSISPFRGSTLKEIHLLEAEKKLLSFENGILFYSRNPWWTLGISTKTETNMKPKTILYVQDSITELSFAKDEFINLLAGASDTLVKIHVDPLNPYYSSLDGILYSKDFSSLYYFPPKSKMDSLHQNLKTVSLSAFSGNYDFKNLTFPKGTKFSGMSFVGVKDLSVDFNYSNLVFNTIYDSQLIFSNAVIDSTTYDDFVK